MILGTLTAILVILGPALAPLLVWGVERWLASKRRDPIHGDTDEADEHITQHLGGNPAGLVNLSHELDRLRREATRKRGHP